MSYKKKLAVNQLLFFYFQNDFRRQSAPSLANPAYFNLSSADLCKTNTLYSVAEVEGSEMTPPMRRSCTNPGNLGNLRNSYSLESLRAFSEKNSFNDVSKGGQIYKSNPLYEQNEKPDTENVELFSKKRIIPGRLQSAMSLESLPSMPDENGQSFDSGMDIDDGNDHIHRKHSISTNDGDSHDNIDVGMFEKIKECHIENDDNKLYSEDDKQEEGKENDIFTINMKNTEEPEEERLKGIYIDMTSVYP